MLWLALVCFTIAVLYASFTKPTPNLILRWFHPLCWTLLGTAALLHSKLLTLGAAPTYLLYLATLLRKR